MSSRPNHIHALEHVLQTHGVEAVGAEFLTAERLAVHVISIYISPYLSRSTAAQAYAIIAQFLDKYPHTFFLGDFNSPGLSMPNQSRSVSPRGQALDQMLETEDLVLLPAVDSDSAELPVTFCQGSRRSFLDGCLTSAFHADTDFAIGTAFADHAPVLIFPNFSFADFTPPPPTRTVTHWKLFTRLVEGAKFPDDVVDFAQLTEDLLQQSSCHVSTVQECPWFNNAC